MIEKDNLLVLQTGTFLHSVITACSPSSDSGKLGVYVLSLGSDEVLWMQVFTMLYHAGLESNQLGWRITLQ
jgi:hypothetical protein